MSTDLVNDGNIFGLVSLVMFVVFFFSVNRFGLVSLVMYVDFFSWTDLIVVLFQVPIGFFLNRILFTNVCELDRFGVCNFFFSTDFGRHIFFRLMFTFDYFRLFIGRSKA